MSGRKPLQTLLIDQDDNILEDLQTVHTSLSEIRVVMAAKEYEDPGCRMKVWRGHEDPFTTEPFKIVVGPVERRRLDRREHFKRKLRDVRCNPML